MGTLVVTVVLVGLCATLKITSQSSLKSEAFFQGSCEKWNPCTQMCLNIARSGGMECRCAGGYTLNTDGFTCDEVSTLPSTVPPEYQTYDESENRAHIEIIHNPGTRKQVIEEIKDDITNDQNQDSNIVDHEKYLKQLAKQKNNNNKQNNHNNNENSYDTAQGVDSNNNNQGKPSDEDSKIAQKKWSYGNYLNPKSYNSDRGKYSNNPYYNRILQSDSPYASNNQTNKNINNNRERPSNRRKNGKGKGKGKGKGRKGKGKGKNKGKNKVNYDGTQSDSVPNKYNSKLTEISNNVLEDELKAKVGSMNEEMKQGKYTSCSQLHCRNSGKCVPDEMRGGYRCQCKLGTEGEFCESSVLVKYPQFRGTGYMAFPVLRGAYREFTINMEFRPDTYNGLLLFSSEYQNARTDFISISLVDEKVEFRYDCGTGPAVITSTNKVELGKWNTLKVHRKDWTGSLTLNDEPPSLGRSQGFFQRITFREDIYLAGYKNFSLIESRVGMQWGFVGCVRMLNINGKNYDMRKGQYVGDAIYGVDVGECSAHTCERVDCLNGGRCEADSADTSVCLCPVGTVGDRCESKIDIYIPSFDGTSYLQFLGLRRRVLMFTKIEIVFKTTDVNGMLLYNGYRSDRTGDFLSVSLVNSYLEFMFDLGTGPALIRSRKPITINEWHTVRLERTGKHGEMVVDNEAGVSGTSKGAYTQLTLTLDLFIGGHRNYDEVNKVANIDSGFKGCIQKIIINDQKLNLMEDYVVGVNIDNCDHPCMGQPCMNGGKCMPVGEKYQCRCPLGFDNTNCEDKSREPVTVPRFNGGSFLLYDDNELMKRIKGPKNDIQMKIRATGPNGLLFWVGEDTMSPNSDYLAIGLDHGHAILRYNLGSGDIVISYNGSRLDDGKWHKIKVERYHKIGYIEIDGTEIIEGTSPGNLKQLNVGNNLYIGGMPIDSLAQNTLKKFTTGFTGCITNVILANDYRINLMHDVIDGENIQQCNI